MTKENSNWLSTMATASRYNVSVDTLRLWRRFEGFPKSAVNRESHECAWNVMVIDAWLRARPLHTKGRPPKWAGVVCHPQAGVV